MHWAMIGSGCGLFPIQCHAINWTSANLLSDHLQQNLGIWDEIKTFFQQSACENMVCKTSPIFT